MLDKQNVLRAHVRNRSDLGTVYQRIVDLLCPVAILSLVQQSAFVHNAALNERL